MKEAKARVTLRRTGSRICTATLEVQFDPRDGVAISNFVDALSSLLSVEELEKIATKLQKAYERVGGGQ